MAEWSEDWGVCRTEVGLRTRWQRYKDIALFRSSEKHTEANRTFTSKVQKY